MKLINKALQCLFFQSIFQIVLCQYKLYYEELMTDDITDKDIVDWKFYSAGYAETDIFKYRTLRTNQDAYKGINQCGNQIGNKIFGGYKYFVADKVYAFIVEKKFKIKIPHWKIKFNVKFFKIDSWNIDPKKPTYDKLQVYIDSKFIHQYNWNCCDGLIDICGTGAIQDIYIETFKEYNQSLNDAIELFETEQLHSQKTLTITFFDTHDSQDNETWGFRELQIYIKQCHLSCMTCSGSSENECLSCYSGSTLSVNKKCECQDNTMIKDLYQIEKCISTQDDISLCQLCSNKCSQEQQYIDNNNGLCLDCDSNCKECKGKSNICISCKVSTYLNINKCDPCVIGCQSCQNYKTCDICLPGYYLKQNLCIKCPKECSQCQNEYICSECATGFIKQSDKCIACPIGCSTCQQQANNNFICSSCQEDFFLQELQCVPSKQCKSGYFGEPIERICSQKCKDGYFQFKLTKKCEKCHPSCSKCFGKEKNNCYECNSQYFFYNFSCESRCPAGTQENRIVWQCNPITKNNQSDNYLALFKQECYIACQMGKYYDEDLWTCAECDPSCLACVKKFTKQKFYIQEKQLNEIRNKKNCTMCKENQYLDTTKKRCVDMCITTQYHDQDHRQCQDKCQQGYYSKNNYCYKCELVGCLNCTEFECLECNQALKRYSNKNGQCICQDGFYSDGVRDECFKCAPGCNKCTSIDECQECDKENNFLLSESICKCKEGMHLKDGICQKCHYSCLSCSNEFSCDECKPNTNRYLDTLCVCQKSYFEILSEQKSQCTPCSETCNECSDLQKCSECKQKYPNRILNNSKCVCREKFYEINFLNFGCTPYPEGCIEMTKNMCSKCDKGYVLTQEKNCSSDCPKGQYLFSENQECVKDCGKGYFANKQLQKCEKCINDCISCQNDKVCEQCQNGIYLLPDTKICSRECPKIGYILQYGQCFKCISNCKVCKNFSTCEECYPPYVTSNTQRCFCLQGNYFNEQTNRCEKCSEFCKECKSANICKVCSDQTRELASENQGNIQCKCKQGYFEDEETKECIKCMNNCEMCENKQSCVKCNDFSYLTEKNICECNSQYFKEEGICKICTLNGCLECLSSLMCLKCKSTFQKSQQNQCILIKKEEEQKPSNGNDGKNQNNNNNNNNNNNSRNNQTQNNNLCHISCDTCTGKERNQCTSCVSSRYLSKDKECVCRVDYKEYDKQESHCELSSDIDSTLIQIQSTVNLSSLSSSIAIGLFSYNINLSILNILLCQQISNLAYVLDYSESRYYEYQSIEQFQAFNIFPILPKIQVYSNSNSLFNQEQGKTFDKLIIPTTFFILIIFITMISYIMKNKCKLCEKIYYLFLHNILQISYVLLSNYVLIESLKFLLAQNYDFLPDFLLSALSLTLVFCLFVQFLYFNYKMCQQNSQYTLQQPSFLKFVNTDYVICRVIWISLDIRRYCVIAVIFLSSSIKTALIINIATSVIFIIIFIKRSPFIDELPNQTDQRLGDSTINSDFIKMQLFQSSFAAIEEENTQPKKSLQTIMNQSRLGYLIELSFLVYFCLKLVNQMYNNIFIEQTSVIIIVIYCSFAFIINILKLIQLLLNLKDGKKKNQQSSKSNILDLTRQQHSFQEFINQLQEHQQNSLKDSPYNIQVRQKFLFPSHKIEKQNTTTNDKQNKIVSDRSDKDHPHQIQKQNTIFRDKVITDKFHVQKNFLNSPNRKPELHFKKTTSFNLDKMEKQS